MRSITSFAFHSILAAALVAVAASSAAAASDFLLRLDPSKGELANSGKSEQVVAQAFHWGPVANQGAIPAAGLHGAGSLAERSYAGEGADTPPPAGASDKRSMDAPAAPGPGALTVSGRLPGCTVGRRYSGAQFASATMRFELKDVVISNCAADSLSLNYARVIVRGWDPGVKPR